MGVRRSQIPTQVAAHVDRGFTQVELLISMAVIAILLAILIPAVQSARETARQQECANQQRQIGVALMNYESIHGHYPAKDHGKGLIGSWIVAILPHLEQQALYDQIVVACEGSLQVRPNFSPVEAFRSKVRWLTPANFHCPSDPAPRRWQSSYPSNSGVSGLAGQDDGMFRFAHAAWLGYALGPVSLNEVSDGLSNTMSVCEWLHRWEDDKGRYTIDTPRRMIWELPRLFGTGADVETVALLCQEVPRITPERFGWRHNNGLSIQWYTGGITVSSYVHAMPPNTASCDPATLGMGGRLGTAGSFHRNGVNGLFADGHVQFISDQIDLSVWRAMGTRASGDVVAF